MSSAHATAPERRRIAIEALGRELDASPGSAASRLAGLLGDERQMIVSADIDGLVSAAMLGSVAPRFKIVAFSVRSTSWIVHPNYITTPPPEPFGVDLFSTRFDNVSNHVVLWGRKNIQVPEVRAAFRRWDDHVMQVAQSRLLAVPSIWAGTEGGYEDHSARSSKYKYPLGSAQILLALLEAGGRAPKFFDRTYLPWLIANCDGGISTYTLYADNARVWWPVLAGAIGPGSLTEQVFRTVDQMRPHDFLDAVHRLDRERQAARKSPWLSDKWNLVSQGTPTIKATLQWLVELTGWRDPVYGGIPSLDTWIETPAPASGAVYFAKAPSRPSASSVRASDSPTRAAELIDDAAGAFNANFYHGGHTGSRFNWVSGWIVP